MQTNMKDTLINDLKDWGNANNDGIDAESVAEHLIAAGWTKPMCDKERCETLDKVETHELVEELSKRDGVEIKTAEPYQDVELSVNGPAVVIVVKD